MQAVKVEGPFLALQTALASVAPNQTRVALAVELSGPSLLPVTVNVTVPQQLHAAFGGLAIGYTLETASLTWPPGRAGAQNVTLSLASGAELQVWACPAACLVWWTVGCVLRHGARTYLCPRVAAGAAPRELRPCLRPGRSAGRAAVGRQKCRS